VPAYQLILPAAIQPRFSTTSIGSPIAGPVTLAPFLDAGIDKLTLPGQLGLNPDRVTQLNSLFPQADFGRRAYIAPHTQVPRISTGIELQVLMPVVKRHFRLLRAYNSEKSHTTLQPPVVQTVSFRGTMLSSFDKFLLRPFVRITSGGPFSALDWTNVLVRAVTARVRLGDDKGDYRKEVDG